MKISSVFLLSAVSALSPLGARAHAQSAGPFLGVGAGASRVAEPDVNAARLAPSLNLRAGWAISPTVSVMLEGSLNGIGSPNRVDSAVIDPGMNGGAFRNRQLTTGAVLASVQVGTPALYVRPGVGISRHAFTSYYPLPADGYAPETSYESGPAAGLTVGRRVNFIPGFPLQVEAVGMWTGGEDSSGSRWSAGIQFAREFHF